MSIAIGASTYGFTIMLMAFLSGIALGSSAYGVYLRIRGIVRINTKMLIIGFGLVQIVIGITALLVTIFIRELPSHTVFLQDYFLHKEMGQFAARQWANLLLAFAYMFVPAFFMGVAFPLAGSIHIKYKRIVGKAVGELLAYNTVGAILGSAISGFLLIYLLGIERSLQILTLTNIGFGLLVILSTQNRVILNAGAACATMTAIFFLALNPGVWRIWDTRFLAMSQANAPGAFRTPKSILEAMKDTKVLYYAEGAQTIVSSLLGKGGDQYFLTNGRTEASNDLKDIQCQYTLGHLPMLLAANPKKVFVLGTGSGMTLGATSVHPSVEQITLAEIEPKVLGVAKTFARYNHNVLDNPKLRIIFNDGRNYLLTTKEKFDVITADPVHPWFSGAGYLYASEYFRIAAAHLNPGGILCQWLPIYELTNDNLKSVVQTFRVNFKYTMVWLTYYDAELIGSNSPIIIDEEELRKRIAEPEVLHDLEQVEMGTPEDLLSFFVMGNEGTKAYSRGGAINTDNNLYLEFSAPHSIGDSSLMGSNLFNIVKYRESILPYLKKPADGAAQAKLKKKWGEIEKNAAIVDQAHGTMLSGQANTTEFSAMIAGLDSVSPNYAPFRFIKNEYSEEMAKAPQLLQQTYLTLVNKQGEPFEVQIAAVMTRKNRGLTTINFVNNNARIIYGQIDVLGKNREAYINGMVSNIFGAVVKVYKQELESTVTRPYKYPAAEPMLMKVKDIISTKLDQEKT